MWTCCASDQGEGAAPYRLVDLDDFEMQGATLSAKCCEYEDEEILGGSRMVDANEEDGEAAIFFSRWCAQDREVTEYATEDLDSPELLDHKTRWQLSSPVYSRFAVARPIGHPVFPQPVTKLNVRDAKAKRAAPQMPAGKPCASQGRLKLEPKVPACEMKRSNSREHVLMKRALGLAEGSPCEDVADATNADSNGTIAAYPDVSECTSNGSNVTLGLYGLEYGVEVEPPVMTSPILEERSSFEERDKYHAYLGIYEDANTSQKGCHSEDGGSVTTFEPDGEPEHEPDREPDAAVCSEHDEVVAAPPELACSPEVAKPKARNHTALEKREKGTVATCKDQGMLVRNLKCFGGFSF